MTDMYNLCLEDIPGPNGPCCGLETGHKGEHVSELEVALSKIEILHCALHWYWQNSQPPCYCCDLAPLVLEDGGRIAADALETVGLLDAPLSVKRVPNADGICTYEKKT